MVYHILTRDASEVVAVVLAIIFVAKNSFLPVEQLATEFVLDEGKVVGIGTHQELMKSCMEYREIYLSQKDEEVEA